MFILQLASIIAWAIGFAIVLYGSVLGLILLIVEPAVGITILALVFFVSKFLKF